MSILTTEELDALSAGSVVRGLSPEGTWVDYKKLSDGNWQASAWSPNLDDVFDFFGSLATVPTTARGFAEFNQTSGSSMEVRPETQEEGAAA